MLGHSASCIMYNICTKSFIIDKLNHPLKIPNFKLSLYKALTNHLYIFKCIYLYFNLSFSILVYLICNFI